MTPSLTAHLQHWLGAWPPAAPVHVVGSGRRETPGWDGRVSPFVGVRSPAGAVLSVAPATVAAVEALGDDVDAVLAGLPAALGRPGAKAFSGVFRWCDTPVPASVLPDAGVWLPIDDPRVDDWLKPFGGEVLVALEDDASIAGVGRKIHDRFGHELAVVTTEAARGRGLARRLVAQAARRVLDDGAVATYLHADANVASAHVAEASGFPDHGWRIIGLGG